MMCWCLNRVAPYLLLIELFDVVYTLIHSFLYHTVGQWSSGNLHRLTVCRAGFESLQQLKTFCFFESSEIGRFCRIFFHNFTWNYWPLWMTLAVMISYHLYDIVYDIITYIIYDIMCDIEYDIIYDIITDIVYNIIPYVHMI